jgi:hypothetical protein
LPCPVLWAKIFLFFRSGKSGYDLPSRSERGALAIVTNVGAGSGGRGSARAHEGSQGGFPVSDRSARRRTARRRTAKSCGPDASAVGVKSRGGLRARPGGQNHIREAMVSNKPDHQGERAISRKTIAQGMPDCLRCPVCSCAHLLVYLHTRPRVQRASGVPCALSFERCENDPQTSGASRRENVVTHPVVIARLDRATQYSREIGDRTEKPQRT